MKILRKVGSVKKSDGYIGEEDRNNSNLMKDIKSKLDSIEREFKQGFSGSHYDPGYIAEKCDSLKSLAKQLSQNG